MNGNKNNKSTASLEKTTHKEDKRRRKILSVSKTLIIKESSFIQTFSYKLPFLKEFSPSNKDFRGSSK